MRVLWLIPSERLYLWLHSSQHYKFKLDLSVFSRPTVKGKASNVRMEINVHLKTLRFVQFINNGLIREAVFSLTFHNVY